LQQKRGFDANDKGFCPVVMLLPKPGKKQTRLSSKNAVKRLHFRLGQVCFSFNPL